MGFIIGSLTSSDAVMLKSPEPGNTRVSELNKVVNRTFSGFALTKADWRRFETLNYTFSPLTRTKLVELVQFLRIYKSKELEIVDHTGETFNAFVILESIDVTTLRDVCSYSISLTFIKSIELSGYLLAETAYLTTEAGEKILW